MISFNRFFAAAVLVALAGPVLAQQTPPAQGASAQMAHMPGAAKVSSGADTSPSSLAFKAADDKMMKELARPLTGNTDQDFVAGMLPHHGGAVVMAKVEIQYGKDPEMLHLAKEIIAAQEKEIALMQLWQKAHSKR